VDQFSSVSRRPMEPHPTSNHAPIHFGALYELYHILTSVISHPPPPLCQIRLSRCGIEHQSLYWDQDRTRLRWTYGDKWGGSGASDGCGADMFGFFMHRTSTIVALVEVQTQYYVCMCAWWVGELVTFHVFCPVLTCDLDSNTHTHTHTHTRI
jgi:hypothetical protein